MFHLARKLLQHTLPGVVRPLHILWNQIIGFFFLCLAILPVPSAVRSYRDPAGMPRLVLIVPFILIMAAFGLSSFLRARRLGRT